MTEHRVRRRTRLKRKQAAALREALVANLPATDLWSDEAAVETADFDEQQIIVVDQATHGLIDAAAGPFLTVRGLLAYRPVERYVTVDMGAIKHVHNGADVMAPGITEADAALQEGDWCWIRDERNHQPLAVGRCLVAGTAMPRGKGKAVASVHHIGDRLWELDSP